MVCPIFSLSHYVSDILGVWLNKLTKPEILLSVAITLVLGGSIGNLVDRLLYGYVIDFFDFYVGSWHFAVFNVADAGISVGVGLMMLESLGVGKPKDEGLG